MSINYKNLLLLLLIPVIILTFQKKASFNISKSSRQTDSFINNRSNDSIDIIIDSNYSLEEATSGIEIPISIKKLLAIADVYYYSFDGRLHKGQVVIAKSLVTDIKEIFNKIKNAKFPIGKAAPIVKYNWDDRTSMEDNNTSAFNYRIVRGTHVLSYHSTGKAIDINPKLNPQIKNGKAQPPGSIYNQKLPGTISDTSFIVKFFLKKNWTWGGNWKSLKDYQHFEKRLK